MSARHCAFLVMDSVEGWSIDADLAIAPLEALDWRVEQVPWRSRETRWNVSTNARNTFLLAREQARDAEPELLRVFARRAVVVQPFIEQVRSEGEYSLFYFGGECSHAILKTPKAGDFRVQEEHGASVAAVAAPEATLVAAADRILELVQPAPAYARCDLVRGRDSGFLLMELELIEPSMYLRMHPAAPARFAAAFDSDVTWNPAL